METLRFPFNCIQDFLFSILQLATSIMHSNSNEKMLNAVRF